MNDQNGNVPASPQLPFHCTKCNVEMVEGNLTGEGLFWSAKKMHSSWGLKLSKKLSFGFADFRVIAFRCPQCNKIELVAAQIK